MNAFNTVFALLAGWDPALTTVPVDAAGIALAFSTWMKEKHLGSLLVGREEQPSFFPFTFLILFLFFFPFFQQDSLFRHLVNKWRKLFDFCFEGKPGVTNIP